MFKNIYFIIIEYELDMLTFLIDAKDSTQNIVVFALGKWLDAISY